MCGFNVFVSSRRQAGTPGPDTIAAFSAALETMHHRGPDDTVVEYADGIAFGFKRLAVIDRREARSRCTTRSPGGGPWSATARSTTIGNCGTS